MIERRRYLEEITTQFAVHKVCALLGPRQCGKTTLARAFVKTYQGTVTFFDMEDPTDASLFIEPKLVLENLDGLIVIDEVQLRPDLFPYLRVLADRYPDRRYLLLGSASRDLIDRTTETLAGRIGYIEVTPITLNEFNQPDILWRRGGFPLSLLAISDRTSQLWLKGFIATFIERDLRQIFGTINIDMRRLWAMLAHYHGGFINYSELGKTLGMSDMTVKKYITMLEQTFMIYQLKPWFANIAKRQIKSPKLYIRDTGILHHLLGVENNIQLSPKAGISWEGFAIEQIISSLNLDRDDCYFWSTSNDAELDLYIPKLNQGFEFKYTESPKTSRSMHIAIDNLGLDRLTVIYPFDREIWLTDKIRAIGLQQFTQESMQIHN